MLSEEQLAIRRKGITATDIGKIVGLSPYGCALDVQMDKQGIGLPFHEHERVKWGNLLERPIREDYADRHKVMSIEGETLQHPTEPWALATPDAMIYTLRDPAPVPQPIRGHEIKTHTSWLSHLYGEPGSDEVPPWELTQCVWNIWVCSAFYGVQINRWDLTVFLDGLPTDYTIWRDEGLEDALVNAAAEFWADHVIGGAHISPDGSEHYSDILKARWPKHGENSIVAAFGDQVDLIQTLKEARSRKKEDEKEEERIVQEIKLILGTSETIEWTADSGKKERINWKSPKDSVKVDYKAVAQEYRENLERIYHLEDGRLESEIEDLDLVIASNTTTKSGSRRFTVPRSWSAK